MRAMIETLCIRQQNIENGTDGTLCRVSFFIFSSNCIKKQSSILTSIDCWFSLSLGNIIWNCIYLFIYLVFGEKEKDEGYFIRIWSDFPGSFLPLLQSILLVWWWWDWNAYVFKLLMRGWDFWAHGSPMALLLGLIFNQTNGQMINGKRNWKWASERAHTHTQILFPLSVLFFFSVLINGEWNEQERFSISKKETGPAAHLLSSQSL
jgi:hypothetical protein